MNSMENTKQVPGEKVIFEVNPSKFVLLPLLLVLAFVIVLLVYFLYSMEIKNIFILSSVVVVGALVELVVFLWWKSTVFRLTNKKVENKYGIIATREEKITLDDIQAVDVENNFWGAIFNYGTINIKAAGANREVDFTNIHNAKAIANQIRDMSTRYRRKSKDKMKPDNDSQVLV